MGVIVMVAENGPRYGQAMPAAQKIALIAVIVFFGGVGLAVEAPAWIENHKLREDIVAQNAVWAVRQQGRLPDVGPGVDEQADHLAAALDCLPDPRVKLVNRQACDMSTAREQADYRRDNPPPLYVPAPETPSWQTDFMAKYEQDQRDSKQAQRIQQAVHDGVASAIAESAY